MRSRVSRASQEAIDHERRAEEARVRSEALADAMLAFGPKTLAATIAKEKAVSTMLRGSPLLRESIAHSTQHNGSRFLLHMFVAVCGLGVLAALAGWL